MHALDGAAFDVSWRAAAAQPRSESASPAARQHRRASSGPKIHRACRPGTRGPNRYAASRSRERNTGAPRLRRHEPRSRRQTMPRAIVRGVISRASNRSWIAICLARFPMSPAMSPGPFFADGIGQERRGAAALKGGGYIGNVTTPEASLSREGICGSVDSRGSLAGRIGSRLTVAGQRRSRTGFPNANLEADYAPCGPSQPGGKSLD